MWHACKHVLQVVKAYRCLINTVLVQSLPNTHLVIETGHTHTYAKLAHSVSFERKGNFLASHLTELYFQLEKLLR